jgi:hypothetical protein
MEVVMLALVAGLCVTSCLVTAAPGTGSGSSGPGAGGSSNGADSGCGGEAAQGGYSKGTAGAWNGSAGNAYGYPSDQMPADDCFGFGFDDNKVTCRFYDSCAIHCSSDPDCPSAPGGPEPVCRKNSQTSGRLCVLPCGQSDECPQGMVCTVHPYGYGRICMWPRDY